MINQAHLGNRQDLYAASRTHLDRAANATWLMTTVTPPETAEGLSNLSRAVQGDLGMIAKRLERIEARLNLRG
jgi:hypothetical protein